MPADRFNAVGGFDAAWNRAAGEDREFCDRWVDRGYRMVYVPEAIIEHTHTLTWRSFFRQHFNYGRGAFYFHSECARRRQARVELERLSFYLGTLRYPFSRVRPSNAVVLAGLIVAAQAANALGFLWQRTR